MEKSINYLVSITTTKIPNAKPLLLVTEGATFE
jgi:hypothetical protein